ncbi:MAG: NAD-dependent epimerase/dehydratase family protein, partial [Halioglobus sp.]
MPVTPVDLTNKKILITGPTGQVALPVVEHYAKIADVYALARFRKPEDRAKIESLGAKVLQADLADASSLDVVPEDFDYVLNFAVVKSGDFEYDLAANAEGVGNLMARCRT